MHFQYVPFIWPLIASAVITLALGIYALRHKDVRGAFPFGVCMLLTALWSAGYALEIAGTDLASKLFSAKVQCMGYSFAAVIWLIMVFRFIERDHWVTRRNILLLLILPVLTVVLAWTNDLHGLMWQNIHLDMDGFTPVFAKNFGPLFWVIAAYSYSLNMVSEFLLGLSLLRKSALYREQSLALFTGLALIQLQNALCIFGVHPVFRYDLTPVVIGVSGLIIAWSIFRFRLFDIVPVARENVVDNMADGLIVLDARDRVVDMNRTAKKIFDSRYARAIGRDAQAFFAAYPVLAEVCCTLETPPGELVIERDGCTKTFEVSSSPLQDGRGNAKGLSIILHDVTERKTAQDQLLKQQRALAKSEEREKVVRELHDSLGQVLGYINIQAQAVREQVVRGQEDIAVSSLERLSRIARDAHDDVREYIQSVRGIAAGEQDFIGVLKKYLRQYNQNYGIRTELTIPDALAVDRIEPVVGRQLFRIIQEALANVRKHAGADAVQITFAEKQGHLRIMIQDHGRGFAQEDKPNGHSFGLGIMAERAKEAGGQLQIETEPGHGTTVLIVVPLSEERQQ